MRKGGAAAARAVAEAEEEVGAPEAPSWARAQPPGAVPKGTQASRVGAFTTTTAT